MDYCIGEIYLTSVSGFHHIVSYFESVMWMGMWWVSESVSQWVSQWVNESVSQWVSESVCQWVCMHVCIKNITLLMKKDQIPIQVNMEANKSVNE